MKIHPTNFVDVLKKNYSIILFINFIFANNIILCQINSSDLNKYEDVIYLKNGSIIHGIVIESNPTDYYKIQTHDGNVYVYKSEDIEKMTKELIMTHEIIQDTAATLIDSSSITASKKLRIRNTNFGYGFPYYNDDPSQYFTIQDSYQGIDGFGLNNSLYLIAIDRAMEGLSVNLAYGLSFTTFNWDNIYEPEFTNYTNFFSFHIGSGISYANVDENSYFGYSTDLSIIFNLNMGGGFIEYDNGIDLIRIQNNPKIFSVGLLSSASIFINKYFSITLLNSLIVSKSKEASVSYSSNGVFIESYEFESQIDLSSFIVSLGISFN